MKEKNWAFNEIDVSCDSCGRLESFSDMKSYSQINKELKEYGWITTKYEGNWVDFCSEVCFNKYKEKLLQKRKLQNKE